MRRYPSCWAFRALGSALALLVPACFREPAPCVDEDLDGFGVGDEKDRIWCEEAAKDCDDTDPAVSPGSGEVCGDGIDQDCDSRDIDTCPEACLLKFPFALAMASGASSGDIYGQVDPGDADCDAEDGQVVAGLVVGPAGTSPWGPGWVSVGPAELNGAATTTAEGWCEYGQQLTLLGADEMEQDGAARLEEGVHAYAWRTSVDGGDSWLYCGTTTVTPERPYDTDHQGLLYVDVDQDRDGVGLEDDCDDSDPWVFPGAAEICGNGLVEDCERCGIYDDDETRYRESNIGTYAMVPCQDDGSELPDPTTCVTRCRVQSVYSGGFDTNKVELGEPVSYYGVVSTAGVVGEDGGIVEAKELRVEIGIGPYNTYPWQSSLEGESAWTWGQALFNDGQTCEYLDGENPFEYCNDCTESGRPDCTSTPYGGEFELANDDTSNGLLGLALVGDWAVAMRISADGVSWAYCDSRKLGEEYWTDFYYYDYDLTVQWGLEVIDDE